MSTYSRNRKKRIKKFVLRKKWNFGIDRKIKQWDFIDIHQIPKQWNSYHEVDFYCFNQKDVYLFRFRKTEKTNFNILKSEGIDSLIYLIADVNFEDFTENVIMFAIKQIEEIGIPKYSKKAININDRKRKKIMEKNYRF